MAKNKKKKSGQTAADTEGKAAVEAQDEAPVGGETVVDQGWRAAQESANEPVGGETVVDQGWRAAQESANEPVGGETVVDQGWRAEQETESSGKDDDKTSIDKGWSGAPKANAVIPEKQAIVGKALELMTDEELMESATGSFRDIKTFRAEVEKLTELVSKTGKKFKVLRPLNKAGGEAALLRCIDENSRDVVAKVFYRSVSGPGSSIEARAKVLAYMATEEGQRYTLPVEDIGLVFIGEGRFYFEIMPFCPDGDMSSAPPLTFKQIEDVTRFLNDALHSIHSYGLLHRDIKPDNIYRFNGRYVLGDFGVAKLATDGVSNSTSFHVGTDGYCAPEALMALSGNPTFTYDTRCDYYSAGPTIASLYEGHFVYDNMNNADIMDCIQSGKLPMKRQDPNRESLENLLGGLCQFSAKMRFGYADVNRWLADHDYTGGTGAAAWPKSFNLLGKNYSDAASLFFGITQDQEHWEEAKVLHYKNYFENFFQSFKTDLARIAGRSVDKYRGSDRLDKGLAEFLKQLYKPGPIVWRGYTYESIRELADRMVNTKTPSAYAELLTEKVVSDWLANTSGIDVTNEQKELVSHIEDKAGSYPETAVYWFGFAFSQKHTSTINGKGASDLGEALNNIFETPSVFYEHGGYETLTDRAQGQQFYGLLYSLGFGDTMEHAEKTYANYADFDKICVYMDILDQIADKVGVSTELLRSFFTQYGPYGYVLYLHELTNRNGAIYESVDSTGKAALEKVASFKPASGVSIGELIPSYASLETFVLQMQRHLTDNPYRLLSGAYAYSGIMCKNMEGVCAFDFLGRRAPLGFCALLEQANGGVQ